MGKEPGEGRTRIADEGNERDPEAQVEGLAQGRHGHHQGDHGGRRAGRTEPANSQESP